MFPQIFGKYVLEREIAAGGMARVYLATLRGAVGFEKRLVVKQIRPELAVDGAFVKRFVEEAKTAVELSHPNIVPVYELGVEQGIYYIAMEYCAGVTLGDVLAYTGRLDAQEGAVVGAEVCRALDYAHRRAGIVHRDVTPRNVLIDDEGAVRLIDFGIAAPVEPSSGRSREVFGSPGHMPLEQLRGEPLGPTADVFAVGALLIEAWSGTAPFRRGSVEACAEALRTPPEPIDVNAPELTPLRDLIARSVALAAADRPPDAEELGRGLRDFARGADSGEVSRRLAHRVRRVRQKLQPETTGPDTDDTFEGTGRDSTPPLVTPAGLTPATKTFAARDEIVEWTRRFSSAPPAPTAPTAGTRKLFSSAPAPRSAPVPEQRRGPLVAIGALLVAVALGIGFVRGQAPAGRPQAPPTAPPSAPTLAVVAPPSPAGREAPPPAEPAPPAPEPAPSRAHPRSSAPLPSAAEVPPPAPVAPAVENGTLKLTADPPAMVSVEGPGFSQTSPTPLRALPLPPGTYRVSFRNETYGSPVTSQVTLASGARRSVHADFRAAVPTITVR